MKISPSQIRKYLDCEFAAFVEYVEKVEPLGQAAKFSFGKATHALMDPALQIHWASGGSEAAVLDAMSGATGTQVAREAFAKLHDEDGTIIDDETAQRALEVVRWNLARMELDKWQTVGVLEGKLSSAHRLYPAVELDLSCELIEGVTLRGRIDWIARHRPTGLVYVVDHKTTKSKFDDTKIVEHDLQTALYRYLCEANDIHTNGALIHLMRDKIPKSPTMNKTKGGMSRANISTTWEIYRDALLAEGLDPEDYDDQRDRYGAAMFRGFFRDVSSDDSRATSLALARAVSIQRVAQHTTSEHRGRMVLPNRRPSRACDGCGYKAWCDATYDGQHPGSLVGTVYRPKKGSRWGSDPTVYASDSFIDFEDRAARQGRFASTLFTP